MQEGTFFLKGAVGTHYKPDLIQISLVLHDIGDDEVSNMDGVKGAKKKSDFQNLFFFQKFLHQTFRFFEGPFNTVIDQDSIEFVLKSHFKFCLEQPA